ncbi:MAG TPA: hypothetical protein DF364_02835 [Ruminococcaceae bacterium]|nr:hypothetical protein [Oscillospiraceae bacterium]
MSAKPSRWLFFRKKQLKKLFFHRFSSYFCSGETASVPLGANTKRELLLQFQACGKGGAKP